MSWKLDNAHTEVQFAVRHMMISKVRGIFEKFEGTIDLDETHPETASVDIKIETTSVNTRDAQRDAHLRSADFFNSEVFPTMTFKSKKVVLTGDKTAQLVGDLTIRDITHEIILDVEHTGMLKNPWGLTSAGFNAHGKINRKEWNLVWNVGLETGGVLVGDDVELNIEAELLSVPEQAAQASA
jgi:polyisoprenoid-binding protein YceI